MFDFSQKSFPVLGIKGLKQKLESYRALGGEAPLCALIQPDVRMMLESVGGVKLITSEEASDAAELKENEREFLLSLDNIKLFTVASGTVAVYIRKYHEAMRLMASDETLSDELLYKQFIKGIKHDHFKIRLQAAMQGEPKNLSSLTKVTFEQLALVLETKEDARGYFGDDSSSS
ncbi:hypothetical protein ADUPG1_013610 [Aduncisulcus paluster]|uniref:Uncharacterized protein n=1 Tax=Aduncisulcus paluster TaxID=2918883 RepID=A0ABQ5K8C1_9EUKA|nr:hypothetical protein ADUPG1_013610 [Aduncisulcus paluster]